MRTICLAMLVLSLFARPGAGRGAETETPHEHAAAAGHSHEHIGLANPGPAVEDPTEIKKDLALWSFVVFLILLGILWVFAWGPISAGLDQREKMIADHIASVERAHEDAKRMLAEHERKLAGAADEVRALMEEARRNAEHAKQEILAEAKASADAERKRALHEIEAATDQALKSLAERSADLAVELAGKIVQSKLSASDHTRLIQEAVARFPQNHPSHN